MGSKVVLLHGLLYLGSYKVIPKRNYYGADGYSFLCSKPLTEGSIGFVFVLLGLPGPKRV